ncbi:RsmD family RNA methyltransferase, partial [Verrucomicrobiales bacterium]|nr:RsmD family RNA methyltransferase [Verrucomicrobiales bacterium]
MRVIAGLSGGIQLTVPKTFTRPTTDRVREAVFSSLGLRIADATVLDLFAGTGSLGIESLSRGAKSALFVEENRNACEIITANLT